ncbi:VRR-NUC domain containing protein [uncultured Caudovirales phage]|uniref:VRR-NUC domain containing protein n=1 Tax=uncultured Caudovirales phage TaxID=2100421 RepID=A0A6J5N7S9_9CAUD|nr:VRR-NUC domain containing protein [uncultured Caudovirales phage]
MANRSEEREQARVVKWSHKREVRELMPELRWLHHSPNGGKRDGLAGAQMTALGVKRGFPDLILPVAAGSHAGLAIEMKSETGSLTSEQREWLAHYAAQGWVALVCRSAEEAKDALCSYLSILTSPGSCPDLD